MEKKILGTIYTNVSDGFQRGCFRLQDASKQKITI